MEKSYDKIPVKGEQSTQFSALKQKPDESFPDFCARVQDAVTKMMGEVEGTIIVIKQILRNSGNADCKKAMAGLKKDAEIEDMFQRCEMVGTEVFTAQVRAAAYGFKPQQSRGQQEANQDKQCFQCGKRAR